MILEREEAGREGRRERDINCLPPVRALTGDQTHNPGMCPDWEFNLCPFSYWVMRQPTEPHWPGLGLKSGLVLGLALGLGLVRIEFMIQVRLGLGLGAELALRSRLVFRVRVRLRVRIKPR